MATNDLSELDQLIHSFEFENQQLVKMIEKEYQMIDKFESAIEEMNNESEHLEEHIKENEVDIKRLEEQNDSNGNLIKNLKGTRSVMVDHEQALSRQLQSLKLETETKRKFYDEHIAKYTAIHEDYMRKYKSFPFAIELDESKARVEKKKTLVTKKKAILADLKQQEKDKKKQLDFRKWKNFIVRMATAKVSTKVMDEKIEILKSLQAEQMSDQVEETTIKEKDFTLSQTSGAVETNKGQEGSAAMDIDVEGDCMATDGPPNDCPENHVITEVDQNRAELNEQDNVDPGLPQDTEAVGTMMSEVKRAPQSNNDLNSRDKECFKYSHALEDSMSHRQPPCNRETSQKAPPTDALPPPTPAPRCTSSRISAIPQPPRVTVKPQFGMKLQPPVKERREQNAVSTSFGPANVKTLRGAGKLQVSQPVVTTNSQANSRLRMPVFGKSLIGVTGNNRPDGTISRSSPLSVTTFGPPRLPAVRAPVRPPRPFTPFVPQSPVKKSFSHNSTMSRLCVPRANGPAPKYGSSLVTPRPTGKLSMLNAPSSSVMARPTTPFAQVHHTPNVTKSRAQAPRFITSAGDASLINQRQNVERSRQATAPAPFNNKPANIQEKTKAKPDSKPLMTPASKLKETEKKIVNVAGDGKNINQKKDPIKEPKSSPAAVSTQPFALSNTFENYADNNSDAEPQASGGFSMFNVCKKGSQTASEGYEGDEEQLASGKSLFSFDRFKPVQSPGSDTSQTKDIFSMFNKSPETEGAIESFFTFQPNESTDDEGGNFLNFGVGSPDDTSTGNFLNFKMTGDSEEESSGNKPLFSLF